jgi:hypothetical protein
MTMRGHRRRLLPHPLQLGRRRLRTRVRLIPRPLSLHTLPTGGRVLQRPTDPDTDRGTERTGDGHPADQVAVHDPARPIADRCAISCSSARTAAFNAVNASASAP